LKRCCLYSPTVPYLLPLPYSTLLYSTSSLILYIYTCISSGIAFPPSYPYLISHLPLPLSDARKDTSGIQQHTATYSKLIRAEAQSPSHSSPPTLYLYLSISPSLPSHTVGYPAHHHHHVIQPTRHPRRRAGRRNGADRGDAQERGHRWEVRQLVCFR
jgi:hypothetical protein